MQGDVALVACPTMLVKIDRLPDTEAHVAAVDGNRQRRLGERRSHVRRHVVGTFGGVYEERVSVLHETGEERLEVAQHVRIGVLLDQQAGRGVAYEEREQAARGR